MRRVEERWQDLKRGAKIVDKKKTNSENRIEKL